MKKAMFVFLMNLAVLGSSISYAGIRDIKDDELPPENFKHIEVLNNTARKLQGKSVQAYHDDTHQCNKPTGVPGVTVNTGTGGEERKMEGSISRVYLNKGYKTSSDGKTTVAVFRVAVQGKSWQKGFKCVGKEYTKRDQDFTGDAYVKFKHSNGGTAVTAIEVLNDHWGMMKEGIVATMNSLGFIVMDGV